jgi:hypothetical protein
LAPALLSNNSDDNSVLQELYDSEILPVFDEKCSKNLEIYLDNEIISKWNSCEIS